MAMTGDQMAHARASDMVPLDYEDTLDLQAAIEDAMYVYNTKHDLERGLSPVDAARVDRWNDLLGRLQVHAATLESLGRGWRHEDMVVDD